MLSFAFLHARQSGCLLIDHSFRFSNHEEPRCATNFGAHVPNRKQRMKIFSPVHVLPAAVQAVTDLHYQGAYSSASNDITILLPTSNHLSMVLIIDLARTVVDSVLDLARNITSVALPVLLGLMQRSPTIVSDLFASQSSIQFSQQQQVMQCRSTSATTQA